MNIRWWLLAITLAVASLAAVLAPAVPALAQQSYAVPITVAGKTYTLTLTIADTGVEVVSSSPELTVGQVTAAAPVSTTLAATQDVTATEVQKAQAATIAYDDLFRYNEKHVGKIVRYVGKVLQVQKGDCLLCTDPGSILRVGVTNKGYGLYDDPVYVEYFGKDRFLEDDIVTLWGTVEGLETYTSILGQAITIPKIKAVDIKLGNVPNPNVPKASSAASTASPSAASGEPVANRDANLRGGPGTGFARVGSVTAGQVLKPVERSADGAWIKLDNGAWLAAFLIDNLAAGKLPVTADAAAAPKATTAAAADTPVAAAATPAPAATEASKSSSSIVGIGQELKGKGWRFKVSEVHRRKALYFYDTPRVAMGNYLIVIIDAWNELPGTDYFANNIHPYLTDLPGNAWRENAASGYAQWQYGGLTSIYTDINPGNFVRYAMAFDIPESTGKVLLSTALPAWVDLGDFSQLKQEDK